MTCAALGVRADELDLPVALDRVAYRRAVTVLEERGIIENARLTHYGKLVEATPVERPWAELLVQADDALVPYLAVMAAAESLHRMTREERDLRGLVVAGSDHLTAYNVYAEAYEKSGYIGEVYGLPRHLFDEDAIADWAERRGVLIKAIEDTALAVASVCRSLEVRLPGELPFVTESVRRSFCDLLARLMPLDLVIDEETADGREARVSKTSVCGSWGPIAGDLRYFADRFGVPRASIEGTQLPIGLIRRYAVRGMEELVYERGRHGDALVLRQRLTYFGFELERESRAIDEFPAARVDEARRVLAVALARGEAKHAAARRHRAAIEEIRELYRRSGGRTPHLTEAELAAMYFRALEDEAVTSFRSFKTAQLRIEFESLVSEEMRRELRALPETVEIRGKSVDIEYDVEEDGAAAPAQSRNGGGAESKGALGTRPSQLAPRTLPVARLRLPEKIARTLVEEELPSLDRPLRFAVSRGRRGAVLATTLAELQDLLDRPWWPEQGDRDRPQRDSRSARVRGRPRRHR
jgi:hypothetical protein